MTNAEEIDYAIAHHRERVEWLTGPDPRWKCGEKVTYDDRRRLLYQSKEFLAKPNQVPSGRPVPCE